MPKVKKNSLGKVTTADKLDVVDNEVDEGGSCESGPSLPISEVLLPSVKVEYIDEDYAGEERDTSVSEHRTLSTSTSDVDQNDSTLDPTIKIKIEDNPMDTNQELDDSGTSDCTSPSEDVAMKTEHDADSFCVTHFSDEEEDDECTTSRSKTNVSEAEKFECRTCEAKFADALNYHRHVNTDCKEKHWQHSCSICKRKFKMKSSLTNHIKTHVIGTVTRLKCYICLARFKSPKLLIQHMSLRHTKDLRCKICGTLFEDAQVMKSHPCLKVDDGVKETGYKCDSCDKCYVNDIDLEAHKILQPDCRMYQCTICFGNHLSKYYYTRHIKTHSEPQMYTCKTENCRQVYNTVRGLAEHIVKIHKTSSLECATCKVTFTNKEMLEAHRLTHPVHAKLKCTIDKCAASFVTEEELCKHVKQDHKLNPEYNCTYCKLTFSDHNLLKTHILTHQFGCKDCDEAFDRPCDLAKHSEYHSKQTKPKCEPAVESAQPVPVIRKSVMYRCSACNKSYKTISLLEKHLSTHPTKQRFLCKVCDRVFDKLSDWSKHATTHGLK